MPAPMMPGRRIGNSMSQKRCHLRGAEILGRLEQAVVEAGRDHQDQQQRERQRPDQMGDEDRPHAEPQAEQRAEEDEQRRTHGQAGHEQRQQRDQHDPARARHARDRAADRGRDHHAGEPDHQARAPMLCQNGSTQLAGRPRGSRSARGSTDRGCPESGRSLNDITASQSDRHVGQHDHQKPAQHARPAASAATRSAAARTGSTSCRTGRRWSRGYGSVALSVIAASHGRSRRGRRAGG